MAMFTYKGLDKTGKEIKSSVNADSLVFAKQKLKSMGIMLISIKEQKTSKQKEGSVSIGGGINIEDLSLMTRQLATLVKAKIQIVEALTALIDQTENAQLKLVLTEVKQAVNEGSSLAKSLEAHPKFFNNVYTNMVEAGEASGTLEIVLLRLADFTEAQMKLKNKIKGAMIYPVIMSLVGSAMMMIIFIFVIPKITKIFITMKKTLPIQTEICIWISAFLKSYWWAVIIGVFSCWYMFKKYIQTKNGKSKWHRAVLRMPIIGNIVTMINVSRFCSTLATLLTAGVNILVAMEIVKNLVANVHMQSAIENSKINIKEGASLTAPLVESGLFPPMVTHMIKLGEKSGELESMLAIVSENYEDQVDSKLQGLTATLEPFMMVAMGGAVAFIIWSVVVPMMELNTLK
jgi:general secretion pathway protein F